MKIKWFVISIFFITIFFSCRQPTVIRQVHTPDATLLLPKIVQAVQSNHFSPRTIDDVLSQDMFSYFINELDPQKEFYTQEDIDHLSRYKFTLDEAISENNFEYFNTAISLLENGIIKAEKHVNQIKYTPDDFTIDENLEINFSKLAYAKNDKSLKERWRKKLKKYLLDQMYVVKQNNPHYDKKKLLANAQMKVQKLLTLKFDKLKATTDKAYIETYVNAFLKVQDYQSEYLSPKEKSEWDAKFTRSFVGIGIRFELEDGYPKVIKTFVGGPVWKKQTLKENDVILKLREKEGDLIDLMGKPMDEIISLIKGERGTSIYLTVKNKEALISEVEVVRDKIEFDQAMSFLLKDMQNEQNIGYIRLPRFYGGDPGSAVHVLNEINILKSNNVQGIIFDVRNNQGGSVGQCRDIVDCFLAEAVYMQSKRSKQEEASKFSTFDSSVPYQGELLILTNSKSGSGSELFSGTMQDYKRAVIVGGETTYGKGSMQTFIEMDDSEGAAAKFGQIKMTVGQFYTASGRSPQSTGIIPDIILTDNYKYIPSGERAQPFSMQPDVLAETKVSQTINVVDNIDQLKSKSEARTQNNTRFQQADKKAKQLLSLEGSNLVELKMETFMKQKDLEMDLESAYEEIFSEIKDFEVSFDRKSFAQDSTAIIKRERWLEPIKSDPYIYECFQIMKDMIG